MRMNLSRALHGASVLFLLILLLAFPTYAQTSRGTVSGTVSDSSGAVIFGSIVELTNPDTGVVRAGTARCSYRLFGIIPVTQQMSGCGPDACLVKVCLNAGEISGGKHAIQDRQRFDGISDRIKANLPPSNRCLS